VEILSVEDALTKTDEPSYTKNIIETAVPGNPAFEYYNVKARNNLALQQSLFLSFLFICFYCYFLIFDRSSSLSLNHLFTFIFFYLFFVAPYLAYKRRTECLY